MNSTFTHNRYVVKKQFFKLFGGAFRIYDPSDTLVLFADMKAFKLKEDIRFYRDEQKTEEIMKIQARSILDFSAAYDVWDSTTNRKIGTLKRKGLKSIIKDEWLIMDDTDQEIGVIKEDSLIMALLRRQVTNLIPQKYYGEIKNFPVVKFSQNFNPFTLHLNVDFSSDTASLLDKRLGLAAAVLMCGIEGRQD